MIRSTRCPRKTGNLKPGWSGLCFVAFCSAFPLGLTAQKAGPPPRADSTAILIDTVKITGRIDDLIGIAAGASEGRVGHADFRRRPITRDAELLESVPGLVVTQHSGEGKANQYFVRGFNLDHGTDFQTRIDGMPINMPTHGHGQGYTDLNFLVPEFVDYINYKLGAYHTDVGDFGSAGSAEFHLVRRLDQPFVLASAGENGLGRFVAGGSARAGRGELLTGVEAKTYDGPWDLPQDLRKLSGIARYSWEHGQSSFSVLALAYVNRWNATDQIPARAVESGLVSRLGQIDSTDGGNSARYSVSGSWRRVASRAMQDVQVYAVYSDLSLYSNFTYFLENPLLGDQFNQLDRRFVLGLNATHTQGITALRTLHIVKAGVQTRADIIQGLGLYRTSERVRYATVREDRVRESGTGLIVQAESRWAPWFRSVLGLRADGYAFAVRSDRPENSGDRFAGILSPKASLVFSPSAQSEIYLSGGLGFHSNDARGTTITVDPVTRQPADRVDPLVRSHGAEIGFRAAPLSALRSTISLWAVRLDSELLFVGDAGATEPSFASRRWGVTLANFFRPVPQLSLDVDLSFANARFAGVPKDASRIPGAIESVVSGGVSWSPAPSGIFGSVRVRHFGSYPLIEDNSIRSRASTLVSADAGYIIRKGTVIRASLLNALNSRANDIEYFYASRLQEEPAKGIEGIHFHPVEPRQIRIGVERSF